MVNHVSFRKTFLLLLPLFLIPSFAHNVTATSALEEANYLDITETWTHLPLLYESQYHNTTALWEEIDHFVGIAPEIIDVEIIGKSYFNNTIKAIRITNELRTYQKAKTLVVSHHHGREQISVEMALQFILYLLTGYGVDPLITDAIDTQEIWIIPTINPDALDMVVNDQNYWLRKNARPFDDDGDGLLDEDPLEDTNGDGIISGFYVYEKNGEDLTHVSTYYEGIDNDGDGLINEDMVGHVDLNRNYDMFFKDGSSWDVDSQEHAYPGETAFSEPEIQVYRDFALQHRFSMAYSLHSGTEATYFAKNSLDFLEPDIVGEMMIDYAAMLPSSFYFNDYFPGDPNDDPYYAAGIWDTWMYFERDTLIPISLELYGNLSTHTTEFENIIVDNATHLITEWKDIFNFYNPVEQDINSIWDTWQPAFAYLLQNTPKLDVDALLHSTDNSPESQVNITFTCTNLSPKLRSMTPVDIYDSDGAKIYNGMEILADSTALIETTFTLPADSNERYEIKIGNEYVGYYHYYVQPSESTFTIFGFSIIGVSLAGLGTSIYLLKLIKIKIRRKT
jgi:hypothetical protein